MNWKRRWVELIGNQIAQFEAWQTHWVALHPEDAPPDTVPDDFDEAVGEMFQNLDKYLNDPDVLELLERHNKVVSLDRAKLLRAERAKRRPL